MEMDGKVVVVTGASMGIGEAIAKIFADQGAGVVMLSRDASRAEAARHRVGHTERTVAMACDVRHREEIDFETNLFAAIASMQAVVPAMRGAGGGTIINISSVAGHIPLVFGAPYSASKFALNAIGKAARLELLNDNIHVLTVCPGYVATDFGQNMIAVRRGSTRPKAVRGITAERVARAVYDGYRKKKREVIVPWTMHPVVKLYQLFPSLVEWGMMKVMPQPEAGTAD